MPRTLSPLLIVSAALMALPPMVAPASCRPAVNPADVGALGQFRARLFSATSQSTTTPEEQQSEPIEPDVEIDEPDIQVNIEEPEIDIETPETEVEPDVNVDVDVDVNIDTGGADHDDRNLTEHEQEKIQKSFPMPSAHRTLEIDNVWGSIEIVGTSSDQVQLTVDRSTRAESKEKLDQARKDVTLDISSRPDSLKLYVNGPFRCDCHDCNGSRHEFEGYLVKMDFQLQVPRDIDLKIKTVNEGRVSVRDINGRFLVRNVNGDIQIRNISGSGSARTVNGPVKVSFRQNPGEASEFQTVNGAVELQFARDLSADFRFKTMNGGIYTDFPVTALPVKGMQEEHRGMKTIFRADRYTSARVNAGGPEIKVENLNGDIRILENHE
jgi:hypothetical protein